MKRHTTDLVSLIFGFLFLAIAAWWTVAWYVDINLNVPNMGWIAAAALIALGLIGVAASLRGDRKAPPAVEEPDDPDTIGGPTNPATFAPADPTLDIDDPPPAR